MEEYTINIPFLSRLHQMQLHILTSTKRLVLLFTLEYLVNNTIDIYTNSVSRGHIMRNKTLHGIRKNSHEHFVYNNRTYSTAVNIYG